MAKIKYHIIKEVTTQWIVTGRKEEDVNETPIARCDCEGIALTIKGMYEKAEAEDES